MPKHDDARLVVSGIGVTASIGQGQSAFSAALLEGRHAFDVMRRAGRQRPQSSESASLKSERTLPPYLGAEIGEVALPPEISRSLLRTASFSGQVALATLHEAWHDARLERIDPQRIGLIVGGSNTQQRELTQVHDAYRGRETFLRPTYGLSFMDSDLCGLCTEVFGIRGFAFTLGGASASGQVALIQALEAVQSGRVDVCIALGALMDLSYWECQGLRALGAMGSDRYADNPAAACRPFDRDRDGFIYGESCAAVVIERAGAAQQADLRPYAELAGWAMSMDGNRNPNPTLEGEVRALRGALAGAGLEASQIDYVNPHGTGSTLGDTTELEALRQCGLTHARLNTTKSIIGHGLSAAGAVELVAVLLQMRAQRLHPSRNLDQPIETDWHWVREQSEAHRIENALNLSMGFGGVNTAVCLRRFAAH